ncbi:peptide deformylase [Phaeovulum vinaykumarii]|uniref:Peptide deformylase n=1 Tax=Phaeovulum vinaykumarii TaxID=407234 RepID=A0A1N7MMQ2_9RHOB|nr:peptide deformylase [Phaeovulum vinaykumarii]SIS87424.1 peptide deformylase [Phaeovulum vinaykumarii]SOC13153.1 peptide deformylase [Phaeovulum vinaykumarii]
MSLLPILRWPDPRLSQAAAPVGTVTDAVRQLAADMLETMYAAPGRGLAAPQVGVGLRLFVMDTDWTDGPASPRVVLDPVLEPLGDDTAGRAEGCLSIPGIQTFVTRPARVRMRWRDLDGAAHDETFTGFTAACVQHEADHLDGILTLDRLDPAARANAEAAYQP